MEEGILAAARACPSGAWVRHRKRSSCPLGLVYMSHLHGNTRMLADETLRGGSNISTTRPCKETARHRLENKPSAGAVNSPNWL